MDLIFEHFSFAITDASIVKQDVTAKQYKIIHDFVKQIPYDPICGVSNVFKIFISFVHANRVQLNK